MPRQKIIIIGGGIAGLSAAYHAKKQALAENQEIQITILEQADYWGGKIITERVDGFVIEGGPDTFIVTKPWGMALCRELGLSEHLHGTNPDHPRTYVLRESRLRSLPEGLMMMVPSRFLPMIRTRLLTWLEKIRMGLDFFIPASRFDTDESLGNFVTRRLGRGAYERLIEPLMSGIYAGDGDKLSLQSTFPYLRDLEKKYGGLIKGALVVRHERAKARRKSESNSAAGIFRTPTIGLAEIVETLVDQLGKWDVNLCLNATVKKVDRLGDKYSVTMLSGELLESQSVILATPASVSGDLMGELNPNLGATLKRISYVSTSTVSLAYPLSDLPRPLDGRGYVIPRCEGREALACTWTSTKFPHRAPDNYALVRVFIGRAGQEDEIDWNEETLLAIARRELELTLGITATPYLSRVFVWEDSMPQYNLGHPEILSQIDADLENHPGLALAGNGYNGIGIPDCIHSGELAAQRVLNGFASQSRHEEK